jgi:hypothetical protein
LIKLKNYYFIKNFIPRRWQIFIRRALIRYQLYLYKHVWPIDENSSNPPARWRGWPHGKQFALVLTHDVETQKGLIKCNELIKLEECLGFRSSFNFVIKDYHVPLHLRSQLLDRGFEVGIHGLTHKENPFRCKTIFEKHAKQINQHIKQWDCVGFRCPSMFHNLDYIHDLNIEYDSSTFDTDPFEPQPDGIRSIFPVCINGDCSQKGYIELPYTMPQDFLLFILMKENSIDIWKKKLDWIVDRGGMALLIVHPDYMNFDSNNLMYDEYPARYYEELLRYIEDKYKDQYWHVLPRDVALWWKEKFKE